MIIKIPIYVEVDGEKMTPDQVADLSTFLQEKLTKDVKDQCWDGKTLKYTFSGKKMKFSVISAQTVKKRVVNPLKRNVVEHPQPDYVQDV